MRKFLIAVIMMAPLSLYAQKFAHFNSADIIPNMKEYVTATEEIQAMAKQFEDDIKLMQEELQKNGGETPTYEIVGQSGPPHAPVFRAAVYRGGRLLAEGEGKTKKAAEQAAALTALKKLK